MDRKKYLDGAEARQLMKTCRQKLREKDFLHKRDAILVLSLLNTGGRISEVRQLKVDDITFGKNPSIRFRKEVCKGKRRGRSIPISKAFARQLRCFLRAKRDDSPYLFKGCNGNPLSIVRCWQIFKYALWESGVPEHYGTHACRHCVGFRLYGQTKDLRLVQEWLGHTSPSTTAIYTAVDPKAMVAAAQGMWQ